MKRLKEDFIDILENQRIKPVFQPIVSLKDGTIIGYEGLSRIVEPKKIKNTEELFCLAGLYGKIWELEQLCRSSLLKKYHTLCSEDREKKLFLNVNPMVIHDTQFHMGFTRQYLQQYNLEPDSIIFEVTERSAVEDMRGFKDTIRHYKSQGYKIAIDDAGSCYSGLNLICDIVPHYMKLDIALIRDIHKDMVKYAMVKSLVEFANLTNIQLIAEGIETEEELKALLKLGVHNGQGYFLRKPNEELKSVEKDALEIIRRFHAKKNAREKFKNSNVGEFRVVLFKLSPYKAFRAYCEKYGDDKGDAVIRLMQNIITEQISENETVAMLDADTVVCVLEKSDYKITCQTIIQQFQKVIREYYTTEDLEKGYIDRKNKNGENKKYPIIEICSERVV